MQTSSWKMFDTSYRFHKNVLGVYFLFISMNVDDWLGSDDTSQKPKTRILTVTFFLCGFLSSIRDVAVDGWALTMLKRFVNIPSP